jgi:hypothetical protein
MSEPRWIERFRCPNCGKTCEAELAEVGQFDYRFERVPVGFEVVTGLYGSDLHCETCKVTLHPMK